MPANKNHLTEDDYVRFRDLVLARTGMIFGIRRRDALARSLYQCCQRAGTASLADYYLALQQARTDSELWDDLVSAITIGETYFFRDTAQFNALRQHILPAIITRHNVDCRLRLWSAGCATGEEPYSLAILLSQLIPDIGRWSIYILATDINRQALHLARQGWYRDWSFRQVDPAVCERFFTRREAYYEINADIRRMVTFNYLNLAEDNYPSLATNTNALDLILCRNVAIYLPEEVVLRLADRYYNCLVPGGWLMVGAAETSTALFSQFTARNFPGATVYQRSTEGSPPATPFFVVPSKPALPPVPVSRPAVSPLPPVSMPSPLPSVSAPSTPAQRTDLVAELYAEGLRLVHERRYDEALSIFSRCLERDPRHALAYYQMARIQANRGRLDEAQQLCQSAIEFSPLLPEAHYTLALIFQEDGKLDLAIGRLKKTIYLAPDFILAHFSLATLYQQSGRQVEAERHRTQALRLAAARLPDEILPGSDGLTVRRLQTMLQAG